jgi:hypothetical protein
VARIKTYKGEKKMERDSKQRAMKTRNEMRLTISKTVVKFAKNQKIGIATAIHRLKVTGRLDNDIKKYQRAYKIGYWVAWERVGNAAFSLKQKAIKEKGM